ncbi:MAG: hypothetical protein CVU79_01470 [Elusimicrobia bacterium HGW-Elusimicrobia-3]|nr:MAG: hypothetical protein CVU79_01470 [Elusimicrobia bacterium HGW-Elusimicrobia-3]
MSENYYTAGKHDYMLYPDDDFADFVFRQVAKRLAPADLTGEAVELGAGMGRFSGPLVRTYSAVALVEPAADYAKFLKKRFQAAAVTVHQLDVARFFAGDLCAKACPVYCFHLVHHLPGNDRDVLFASAAARRHKLVIIEPNYLNPLFLLQLLLTPDMRWREEKDYLRLHGRYFKKMAAAHGLKVSAYARFCFFPPSLTNRLLKTKFGGLLEFFEPLCALFAGSYRVIIVEPV